ncbi:5-hydroxyisourate hydrolase, partial [Cuculus canorus]
QAEGMTEMVNGSLTTHVLNTATGLPADGVAIRLARLQEPGLQWTELEQRVRESYVNCMAQPPSCSAAGSAPSIPWGLAQASHCLLTLPQVVFTITDTAQKLHLPLLISPYSYTTYRGS